MTRRRRLIESTWTATRLCDEGGDLVETFASAPTLQFDTDRAAGSTGVNRWYAPYTHIGADLCFGQVGMTMMAAAPPLMDQEQLFLDALNRSDCYAIAGETLEIREGDEIVALFAVVVSSINGDWELLALNNGEGAIVSLMPGTSVTAHIAEGSISGSSGCNRYRAACDVDRSQIRLGSAMGTRAAEDEPAGAMEQELHYLSLFEAAHRYEIVDGTRLTIVDDDGARLMEFRRAE